ncbi:MAG: DUF4469 domain-containing protein [Tannerella sp.]|jgi:hypothetical protein|nr:DUF4469 domain-containing protein [Tannerella sp.]
MSKYEWRVRLRPNSLTEDPNDYLAEVETAGETRRQSDIIDHIVAGGSDIRRETIKAVLDGETAAKEYFVLAGYSVFDDLVHLGPRVDGSWSGKETFTEGKHRVTVNAHMSKEMREKLKQVGVRVTGIADPGAHIMLVTDQATQLTDGTITPGDDILIVGDKIRVVGKTQPDGTLEPGINVYFDFADGVTSVPAQRITENAPSRVLARVPATLTQGNYRLRIVTRFTTGTRLLAEPRIIEYKIPLKVL